MTRSLLSVFFATALASLPACSDGVVGVVGADPRPEPGEVRMAAASCGPRLERFPVAGPYNNGWDNLDWQRNTFGCDGRFANSDFRHAGPGDPGHYGNDIFGARGTPIVAARAGRVAYVSVTAIGGRNVGVVDECGWTTYYAHLESFAPGIAVGQSISAGDPIGTMGDSGSAQGTPVHLHFSVYPDGIYEQGVDPFPLAKPFLSSACASLSLLWYERWNGGTITSAAIGGGTPRVSTLRSGLAAPDLALTGDFDGDGRDDVLWYDADNARVSVMITTADGTTAPALWLAGFGKPDWAAAGDIDGDGKDDLLWYEQWNDGALTVALSKGDRFVSAGKTLRGLAAPWWAGVGDFDGDGRDDIAWYRPQNKRIEVTRSLGTTLQQPRLWRGGMLQPQAALVGDFDGDGKDDIAWHRLASSGRIFVARSTGSAFAVPRAWAEGFGKADWASAADVDGDGKADLLWYEHWNGASVTLARSRGDGFDWAGKLISGWGRPDWASVARVR